MGWPGCCPNADSVKTRTVSRLKRRIIRAPRIESFLADVRHPFANRVAGLTAAGDMYVTLRSHKLQDGPWQRRSCLSAPRFARLNGRGVCSHNEMFHYSHPVVIRAAAAFWGHPGDDLVWVGDVAGFAVDAVTRVQADALAVGLGRVVDHFVDIGRTEILARAAEFFHAARIADVGVVE